MLILKMERVFLARLRSRYQSNREYECNMIFGPSVASCADIVNHNIYDHICGCGDRCLEIWNQLYHRSIVKKGTTSNATCILISLAMCNPKSVIDDKRILPTYFHLRLPRVCKEPTGLCPASKGKGFLSLSVKCHGSEDNPNT